MGRHLGELGALRARVQAGRSAMWANPAYAPAEDPVARADLDRACADWAMLAPLLARVFPDLDSTGGRIGSDLIVAPRALLARCRAGC